MWERKLRLLAGQDPSGETFIGRLLHDLLFYEGPPWVFTTCYIACALLVLGTLVLAPPRWQRRQAPVRAGAESVAPRLPHNSAFQSGAGPIGALVRMHRRLEQARGPCTKHRQADCSQRSMTSF